MIEHGLVEQMTFVIAPDGKVAATVVDPSPTSNVAKALEAVQRLAAKQLTGNPSAAKHKALAAVAGGL